MFRSMTYAATAAALAATAFAPAAFAEGETVNLNVRVDVAAITDADTAESAIRDVERQARKACRYVQPVTHFKRTDWACVAEIIDLTVEQLDEPVLTIAHAKSERMIQIAQKIERQNALQ